SREPCRRPTEDRLGTARPRSPPGRSATSPDWLTRKGVVRDPVLAFHGGGEGGEDDRLPARAPEPFPVEADVSSPARIRSRQGTGGKNPKTPRNKRENTLLPPAPVPRHPPPPTV